MPARKKLHPVAELMAIYDQLSEQDKALVSDSIKAKERAKAGPRKRKAKALPLLAEVKSA